MPTVTISKNQAFLISASKPCPKNYRAYPYTNQKLCVSDDVSIDILPAPDTITISHVEPIEDQFPINSGGAIQSVDQWRIIYEPQE